MLPGGKKLHGKLVEAANKNMGELKKKGTQEVLRYATVAVAAVKARLAKHAERGEHGQHVERGHHGHGHDKHEVVTQKEHLKPIAEIDVTGYPLEKVLACKTGKRKLDSALESAFKKLDFKTKDFQPKTDPVLRVVGGPKLDERAGKRWLVFYPLQLEHIVDMKGESNIGRLRGSTL